MSPSEAEAGLAGPSPSWQTFGDLLDRAQRHAEWADTAHWALGVLSETLGEHWPELATRAELRAGESLPLLAGLSRLSSHTIALAETAEWALRLRLIRGAAGFADVRRDLSRDVSAGRVLHSDLQLLLACLASRCGWDLQLEPAMGGATRPGDLLIESPGTQLLVETRVLTQPPDSRRRGLEIDQMVHRVTMLAVQHGVWLEGELTENLDDATVCDLERWIPIEALSARLGHTPALSSGAAKVRLVARDGATGGLTAPGPTDNLWPRMISAIADKAERMSESGMNWLRLIPFTGLFLMTPWAQLPLTQKLYMLAAETRAAIGDEGPEGIVVSSASGLSAGPVAEETVRTSYGVAVRRAIAPLRARETLIIPLRDTPNDSIDTWVTLADAEADWLPWALAEAGLPPLERIVPGWVSP